MSPSAALAAAREWFAQRFAKRCQCQALDVRVEAQRLECGKCGARIDARNLDPRAPRVEK